ncbi:unnamed protein product [Bathycoccus prasinos]|jgi:hypothetical protein
MTVEDECISGSAYPAFMGLGDRFGPTTNSSRRKSAGGGNENATSHNATTTRSTKRANKTLRGEGEKFKIGNETNEDKEDDTDEEEEEEEEDQDIKRLTERHGGRGMQNACSIGNIARAIFRDIREKKKGLSETDLVALECIFGETNLGRALDVASSRGGVTRFIGKKSRRTVYAVKATTTTTTTNGGGGGGMNGGGATMNDDYRGGGGGQQQQQQQQQQQHLTYPDHFCACKGFTWDVVSRDEKLMCKHMLAAALAESVGGCDEVEMDDAVLANVLAREMLE